MVAAHSPYSSNVILSPSFLFVFSRGRRGDLSETSYIAGAEFSANGGSPRVSGGAVYPSEGLLTEPTAATQPSARQPLFLPPSGHRLWHGSEDRIPGCPLDPAS